MDAMRAQAERFGAEMVTDDVATVDLTAPVKTVTDSDGTTYAARSRHPRHGLGLPRARAGRRRRPLRARGVVVRHL